MNPQSFSILGYLSVLLWIAVPVLWLLRNRLRIPGWLPLIVAVLSTATATINSRTHVNRIEGERIQETPDALMLEAAKRKAVEDARAGEVADIRFAEDGADDFIDKAGMDGADLKYVESLDDSAGEPEWKNQKKTRGSNAAEESGDLDDLVGGEKVISGVSSKALPEDGRPPIMMSEAHVATAHRLDRINLSASRMALLVGVIILVIDYLTRANSYARASYPLPLPSSWRNAFTPLPAFVRRPEPPRRPLSEELAWLVRRGDVFICFTKDISAFPQSLPRAGKNLIPVDILRVQGDLISDQFVFETLWYGRACFVVDGSERADMLFVSIFSQLQQRMAARACTRHNVHLVWNLDRNLHADDIAAFEQIASPTGFSLFYCKETSS